MGIGCDHDARFTDTADEGTSHCVYCRALAAEREVERLLEEIDGYVQGGFNGASTIPCCKCGGRVVEFTVPNKAWNTIIRGDQGETDQEYLCLKCFAEIAAVKIGQQQGKLHRVRDWLKFAANSPGGIVAEIDSMLEAISAAEGGEG